MDTERIIDEIINSNSNFLIHGPGGTGKSYLIKELALKAQKQGLVVYKTATTGIAAINISGTTFHRFAGVGIGSDLETAISKVLSNKKAKSRWTKTDLLIIDEISMLGNKTFDMICAVACRVRQSDKPFGGLRVVFSGDFLQLPPVSDGWIFESLEFKKLNLTTIHLTKYKRFTDEAYTQLLSRVRTADCIEQDIETLYDRLDAYNALIKDEPKDTKESNDTTTAFENLKIEPTILYSHKADVETYNMIRLNAIKKPEVRYEAVDAVYSKKITGQTSKNLSLYSSMLNDACERTVVLKVGAQVMLKINKDIEKNLVNGSRGVVLEANINGALVKFHDCTVFIERHVWEIEDGNYIAKRSQIPLILAYSLTIHKIQGCTIDSAVIDLSKIFESGQAYVALSRVKNLKSLYISGISPNSIMADKKALKYLF